MTEDEKSHWALIPPYILEDDKLSTSKKIMWGVINSFEDGCTLSNSDIAQKINGKKGTVSNYLTEMVIDGYIERNYIDEGRVLKTVEV